MSLNVKSWLAKKLQGTDWALVKGSTLLSIGNALARILGLAFSLVLAGVFTAEEYGEIRYSIAIASIVAIGTMPFGQHVISRFVSKYHAEKEKLDSVLTNSFVVLLAVFVLTLAIGIPILLILKKFNPGVLAIFFGESLFYTYWGLSSGFLEPKRLTTVYLGSNIVQILLVFLLIQVLGIHSTTLALLIYGLSYLLPLTLVVILWPLPGRVNLKFLDRNVILGLLRFSVPIWISHACYTLSISLDLLFVKQFQSASQLGAYSLSKTLASVFIIVPSGISTLLMPKVAASPEKTHRSLLVRMIILTLLIDGLGLLLYLPLAHPVTEQVFGEDYLVNLGVTLFLSIYMILYGVHGLITAVLVGNGKPQVESASRILELATSFGACLGLIPRFGLPGAAGAMILGKLVGLGVYGLQAMFSKRHHKKVFSLFNNELFSTNSAIDELNEEKPL